MCAVTHKAKPYQLAFHIKKSLDDVIGTQHSAFEANLTTDKIFISLCSMLYLQRFY